MIKVSGKIYLTVTETAEFVGLSVNTVYQNWKLYGWKEYRYGKALIFERCNLTKWMGERIIKGDQTGLRKEAVS